MATTREIRRRIRSIKNTAKITKAMELVAASKMRRAQENVLATRPYANRMWELIQHLGSRITPEELEAHPLLRPRPEVKAVGLVLITPDRGLCGPLNSNILRMATRFILDQEVPVSLLCIGRKGRDYMRHYGYRVLAEVEGLGDYPRLMDVVPIARNVIDGYLSGEFDRVYILYTDFINTLTQRPSLRQLFPVVDWGEGKEGRLASQGYIYEPDASTLLSQLLPRYVEVLIYQAVLESVASEHSARMVAMRNATENAQELIYELTLTYNKARQAGITKEIMEIVGGAAALAE